MTSVLIAAILVYQRIAPAALRARCIFARSCSATVLDAARSAGFAAAMHCLARRWRQCRPGYYRLATRGDDGDACLLVMLADGSVVTGASLSARVRAEFT